LIIEIDGETHVGRESYDANRSATLGRLGWKVIRFTNADVMENLEGVLQRILDTLEANREIPHPGPLPQAGEGETNPPPQAGEGRRDR
jgi:very-short-patch-repair endonuclease